MAYSEKKTSATSEEAEGQGHQSKPLSFQQNVILMIKILGVAGVILALIWFLDKGSK